MKLKKILSITLASLAISANAFAMNWNQYDNSPDYTTSSMHQGHFTVGYLPSLSIDLYTPPIYALSVSEYAVENNGLSKNIGRSTYLLNYQTKEVQILDLTNPEKPWLQLPMNNPQEIKNINKLFRQAYGIDFISQSK